MFDRLTLRQTVLVALCTVLIVFGMVTVLSTLRTHPDYNAPVEPNRIIDAMAARSLWTDLVADMEPCIEEDEINCYWLAGQQGNRIGNDLLSIQINSDVVLTVYGAWHGTDADRPTHHNQEWTIEFATVDGLPIHLVRE